MKMQQLLSKTSEQLKKYCQTLSNEEKIVLYRQLLNEAKNIVESSRDDTDQLKKLSKAAVAIEETTDKELLKSFNDDHPLRNASIVVCSPENDSDVTNYVFSLSNSSELYDLEEDREKAIYQAIKSNDVELVKQLLIVLLPDICFEEINLEYLEELENVLFKFYEKLKPELSQDMKNYLDKKLSLYRFLCNNFNVLAAKPIDIKGIISLFAAQPDVDYQVDKLLLSLIAEDLGDVSKIDHMIELLKKHEKFAELEYKVKRLKSELASGKTKYSVDIIKASIEERENEMREIEEKYIKANDLIDERKKLLEQL